MEPDETLVRLADRVREHFGAPANVSSGVRCQAHNDELPGSAKNSYHLRGKAMGFCVRGVSGAKLLALWGLCHTKNPADAKTWVDPLGTSGIYMKDECYKAEDGTLYRCLADNTVYDASYFPSLWEVIQA